MSKNWAVILLLLLSIATHFAFFGYPNQTVFDEVHFGKFISGYFTGEYFFDIHPPLGKLLISGLGYLTGFKPGFSFANIGESFPDQHYLWLRFLPTLAGTFLPLVIFLLALELGFSTRASFLAGVFIIFENALNIQSRFILLDAFLLLFGFSALLFYFYYLRSRSNHPDSVGGTVFVLDAKTKTMYPESPRTMNWLILTGLAAGLAASVKWTGLAFLGMILVLELARLIAQRRRGTVFVSDANAKTLFTGASREILLDFLGLILIPVLVYLSVFAIHFHLLPKSGPGDLFMSPGFQKTLTGNPDQNNSQIKPLGWFGKFKDLNEQMYLANQRLTASHPYGSKWYTWPFLYRPIFYWQKSLGNKDAKIYLLGNPLIWWASTVALIFLILNSLPNLFRRKLPNFTESFLLFGYFINLLPFIGIQRVMFLYHYFPSLIFALLTLAYLTDQTRKKGLVAFFLIVSIFGFIYFSPFTYGLPITQETQRNLFWLQSWR